MKPDGAVREGDDYIVWWETQGLALHFTRVRETDSSIRALATPITMPDRKRILAPMMISLFTKADRERMADAIRSRVESEDSESPEAKRHWRDSVEDAFAAMIDIYTTPDPAVDLSVMDDVPDEPDLVWPILTRNQVNVWLADQKSGKSYDALLIAAAIAAGRGDLLPEPLRCDAVGPVIYCDSETDAAVQRKRLCRVAAGLRLPRLPPVRYLHIEPPFTNHASHIRAEVARLGAVFFILDSLTFSAGGNLNDTEVSIPTMNAAGEMGKNCTKLLIAHHGKAGRGEHGTPSVLGSAAFEFKARNLWLIRVDSEPGESHILQAWKHRYASDSGLHRGFGIKLAFNESNTAVRFTTLGASQSEFVARHSGSVKDRVLAAVVSTELMKSSTKEIVERTGIRDENVARAARDLVQDGRLKVIEGGKGRGNTIVYGAVDAVRPAPAESNQENNPYISKDIYNNDDYFPFQGGNNHLISTKESKIVNDSFEDDRGWAGLAD